jgi:hypothetical protein
LSKQSQFTTKFFIWNGLVFSKEILIGVEKAAPVTLFGIDAVALL